ncbi:DUF3568 family protein [bacterium AH-315-E10]|nr:DUF3568 family protein [bacterium AH-315-E10]
MKIKKINFVSMLLLVSVIVNGCRAVTGALVVGTVIVVGAAGVVGYTVYEGGKTVIVTVVNVGSAMKKDITNTHQTIVISRGTLKADCNYTVQELYNASRIVFKKNGFKRITGKYDALTGILQARTASNYIVEIQFKTQAKNVTTVQVRTGSGNLKHAELIYDDVLSTVAANKNGGRK